MPYDALRAFTSYVSTPGADKFSRRGCELMNKYFLEIEMRGLAGFSLACNPEVPKQYGEAVQNDLLARATNVMRNANRLFALGTLLEVNYDDKETPIDQATVEGFRRILTDQMPHLVDQVRGMSQLASTILHTVEV